MHNESRREQKSVRVFVHSAHIHIEARMLKQIHAQHLCCCCSALQWTGLVCWCWRCWRFCRSAACNWRTASTAGPPGTATNTLTPSLRRKHGCWCYSTEKLQRTWSLHPEISSTFIHRGERMQYMTPLKKKKKNTLHLLLLHLRTLKCNTWTYSLWVDWLRGQLLSSCLWWTRHKHNLNFSITNFHIYS